MKDLRQKASWRATLEEIGIGTCFSGQRPSAGSLEENPKWRADRWQCETQSDLALGGSDGNGGSAAGAAGPCAEVEGLAPPPVAPRDLGAMDGAAKMEPPE